MTNARCKDCGGRIHRVETQGCWYHDALIDVMLCPATVIEPHSYFAEI